MGPLALLNCCFSSLQPFGTAKTPPKAISWASFDGYLSIYIQHYFCFLCEIMLVQGLHQWSQSALVVWESVSLHSLPWSQGSLSNHFLFNIND